LLLAEIHNNTAGAAVEYNDADLALAHFQIYNKMLVTEHEGQTTVADSRLTSSFFNVGLSYAMRGDYDDATKYFNLALGEAERLSEPRQVKFARSLALINLGMTYWLVDRQEETSELLKTALREREELLGPNDRQSMMWVLWDNSHGKRSN
jgi:tetratricopeptide (TPR) repeat protein